MFRLLLVTQSFKMANHILISKRKLESKKIHWDRRVSIFYTRRLSTRPCGGLLEYVDLTFEDEAAASISPEDDRASFEAASESSSNSALGPSWRRCGNTGVQINIIEEGKVICRLLRLAPRNRFWGDSGQRQGDDPCSPTWVTIIPKFLPFIKTTCRLSF
jgi:hypothetical protein